MKRWRKILGTVCVLAMMVSMMSVHAWGAADPGIALQINGEYVALTDARPELKNGRTFIPARAAFEALGAEVEWDPVSGSVIAARDGVTVVMTAGSTVARVTGEGKPLEMTMDAAPYFKNGRTYVPVRFAAEFLHCIVGWDNDERTVIIIDPAALLGGATFDNLNGWMAAEAEQEPLDNGVTTGSAALKLTVPDEIGVCRTYPLKVDFRSHAALTKQQLELSTDFKDLARLLLEGSDLTAAERNEFLKLCKAAVEARMDFSTGKIYFSVDCPLLLEVTEKAVGDGDLWYLVDANALLEEADMPGGLMAYLEEMQSEIPEDLTFEELLYWILASAEPQDACCSYDEMRYLTDVYCAILSDQAMVRRGDDYRVEYTLQEADAAFRFTMTYQTSGGRLTGVLMDMEMEDGYGERGILTMKALETGTDTSLAVYWETSDGMKLDFALTAKTVESTAEPATEPPAGAQIVDVMKELGGDMPDPESSIEAA